MILSPNKVASQPCCAIVSQKFRSLSSSREFPYKASPTSSLSDTVRA